MEDLGMIFKLLFVIAWILGIYFIIKEFAHKKKDTKNNSSPNNDSRPWETGARFLDR